MMILDFGTHMVALQRIEALAKTPGGQGVRVCYPDYCGAEPFDDFEGVNLDDVRQAMRQAEFFNE